MNKAIIIGASSGIGKELAKILDTHNYSIGIVARRLNLLKELQAELQNKSYIKQIDISKIDDAQKKIVKANLPIVVTDIKAGFVDTAMAKGDNLFWVASPTKAAYQIFKAIKKKKSHAYITKRWCLIAWLLKILPDVIYNRI